MKMLLSQQQQQRRQQIQRCISHKKRSLSLIPILPSLHQQSILLYYITILSIVLTIFDVSYVVVVRSSSSSGNSNTNSLPRSRSRHHYHHHHHPNTQIDDDNSHAQQEHVVVNDTTTTSSSSSTTILTRQIQQQQLWNPSELIDPNSGLLKYTYQRIRGEWEMEMKLRRTKNTYIEEVYNNHCYNYHHVSSSVDESSSKISISNYNNNNNNKRRRRTSNAICQIRQVPGDGNCLFHSISLGLNYVTNRTHYDLSTTTTTTTKPTTTTTTTTTIDDDTDQKQYSHYPISNVHTSSVMIQQLQKKRRNVVSSSSSPTIHDLYIQSQSLRDQCVQYIRNKGYKKLYLQGMEYIRCSELIDAAAQQYNISAIEYCNSMAEDSVWGGGPEIVVLCNLLQRPIHVYELTTTDDQQNYHNHQQQQHQEYNDNSHKSSNNQHHQHQQQQVHPAQPAFVLRRMACFGSPKYDYKDAIHILSADSRFPDLRPGQQLRAGNHFLAVFPIQQDDDDDDDDDDANLRKQQRRKRIRRGGDSSYNTENSSFYNNHEMKHNSNDNRSMIAKFFAPVTSLVHETIMQYVDWWNEMTQRYFQ